MLTVCRATSVGTTVVAMDREDFTILGMDLLKKAWLVAIKTAADNTHFIGKDSVRSVVTYSNDNFKVQG